MELYLSLALEEYKNRRREISRVKNGKLQNYTVSRNLVSLLTNFAW